MSSSTPGPVLALDFGGTKLAAGVIDLPSGKVRAFVQRKTPAVGGAEASIKKIIATGQQALKLAGLGRSPLQAVGISFGGPVSRDRRTVMRSMHVKDWEGVDLPERIGGTFNCPAAMDNDANAAALGEWVFGAGKGADNLLYIQVSTGVGAGLVLGGKLFRGQGLAGEFGHITVAPDGPACSCGKSGCVESLCSGWAIARDGRDLANSGVCPQLTALAGGIPERVTAKMVLGLAREGEPQTLALAGRAFRHLAVGIAGAVCLLDPEIVVIGGGVARSRDLLLTLVQAPLDEFLPLIFRRRHRVVLAELGGPETILGAALLTHGY